MEWNVLVYLPPASCCVLEVVCGRHRRAGLVIHRIHVRNEPQSLQNIYAHGEQLYRIWRTLVLRCVAWQKLQIFHWKDLGNNKQLVVRSWEPSLIWTLLVTWGCIVDIGRRLKIKPGVEAELLVCPDDLPICSFERCYNHILMGCSICDGVGIQVASNSVRISETCLIRLLWAVRRLISPDGCREKHKLNLCKC